VSSTTAMPTSRFRGVSDLRLVGRQVYYEQLNFWLNPVGAVFTIGFSVVFLLLVGSSAGHSRSSAIDGHELIKYYVPVFAAYGVMAACFNTLGISLVARREMGLLKRLRLSPLPIWAMLSAVFANYAIISGLQVVTVLLIGRFGYHVAFPSHLLAFVVVLAVGVLCFSAVGIAVSTLIPNQEAGAPVTSIVFFVLLFLSGLWFPIGANSGLAKFSTYFPVRHLMLAVYTAFIHAKGSSGWAWHDILVMAIWGAAGVFVAARRWSWAPRQARQGGVRRSMGGVGMMGRRNG
jgi:ABC-2 type transport system permease protein